MFEIVIIALTSTAVAFLVVWLVRKLTDARGASQASLSGSRSEMEISQQQGYVSWDSLATGRRASRKPQRKGNAKPWGW